MRSLVNIDVINRQRGYRVNRQRLCDLARAVMRAEGVRACDVEIAVVGDAEIAALNERYLSHRGPTDVLSFDLSDNPPPPAGRPGGRRRTVGDAEPPFRRTIVGQVVVSADTARRSASQIGHSTGAELALYVIHGLLHLLGHDDLSEPGRTRMHARQRELAARLGLRLRG